MFCTWKDCSREAVQYLCDKNDKVWARLCKEHWEEHEKAFINLDNVKGLLKVWVLAQGGAAKIVRSEEMQNASRIAAKLAQALKDIKLKSIDTG